MRCRAKVTTSLLVFHQLIMSCESFQILDRINRLPTAQHSTNPATIGAVLKQKKSLDATMKVKGGKVSSLTFFSSSSDDDEFPTTSANVDQSVLMSAQDDAIQRAFVVQAFAALAVGAVICVEGWYGLAVPLFGTDYIHTVATVAFPLIFGTIFTLVGIAHFLFVANFARMVPPKGTWGGLWQLPAPFQAKLGCTYAEYHSYASGILEIIGGVWLFASGLGWTSGIWPAWLLLALTVAVSPANLYMYTHNASPGGIVPDLPYPGGHYARFALQCGLISNFWLMAHPPR